MSGGIVYSVTRSDVLGAIELLQTLGSNATGSLWCEGSGPPEHRPIDGSGHGVCGHSDDWYCAGDALGISEDAIHLAIAATNRVASAWSDLDVRKEEQLVILAPRYEATLFSSDLETECLLRGGWIPYDYRIVRNHHEERGKYIPLSWEYGDPETYYVRGHVEAPAFAAALRSVFLEHRMPKLGPIRHGHAFWAFNGSDAYGNPNRTLTECSARGGFAITAMDVHEESKGTA